jgi:hypothetical protein
LSRLHRSILSGVFLLGILPDQFWLKISRQILSFSYMIFAQFFAQFSDRFRGGFNFIPQGDRQPRRLIASVLLTLLMTFSFLMFSEMPSAIAGLKDDHFDGNIYALYGGNGSLVPPKITLEQALANQERGILLVFYVDDSQDSKQYASVVSQLQSFYGRSTDILPIMADAIPVKAKYLQTEPGYYYEGVVPQVLVFNQSGQVVFNAKGQVPFIEVDNAFRKLYNLPIRSESQDLKQRTVNEFNTELSL